MPLKGTQEWWFSLGANDGRWRRKKHNKPTHALPRWDETFFAKISHNCDLYKNLLQQVMQIVSLAKTVREIIEKNTFHTNSNPDLWLI